MNFLRKIVKTQNFWPLLTVVFFGVLAARSLIFERGYFNMHDDLQMMRQLEMQKCLLDKQIPCRWVPDMGYGMGFPLFNFYPPFPYLVGEVFKVMQFSYVDTVKLTFALSFITSGITMYFLAKEFFGKWGGVVSSIFYIWAPYHSVDIYVRGAMNEGWALTWFPIILWTSYRLIKERRKSINWIIALSLSWVGLLLSHNIMVMIFTPVFAGWCFVFWIKGHSWQKFFQVASSGMLAASLTAFFTIPAIFEQKYVHVDTLVQGYYEYIAHYATIGQLLLSRYWGYGPSIWGPNDGMPFQIGQIHWVLSLVILVLGVVMVFRKKIKAFTSDSHIVIIFAIAVGWFAAFMAHQNSTFIWQHFKPLDFVQFPWRFLTLVVLGLSLASGGILVLLEPFKKLRVIVPSLIVVLLVIINWNYFQPQFGKMGPLTDTQKFSGVAWSMQKTAGILDYLPKTAKFNPKDPPNGLAEIISGKGEVVDASQGTNWVKFGVNLATDSLVRINIYEFPTWNVTVDGSSAKAVVPNNEDYGRMYMNISKGNHIIYFKLTNTPLRTICNSISLIAWVLLLSYPVWKKRIVLQFKRE